jgi:hypothetical protein
MRRSRTQSCFLASFIAVSLCASSAAVCDDGLKLFHKMQDALGGADKIAAIHDFEQQVLAESWDANGHSMGEVRKRTRWVGPRFLRADQTGPGSTYVLYFDGTSGWEILPGTDKAVELSGGELKFAQKYIRDLSLNVWLADRDPRYKISSPAENVVRISDGDVTHQLDFTLDPKTWLPVKTTSISLSDPAHPVASETVTADWETVQGVRFVHKWSVHRGGLRIAEATVQKTTLNSGLKPEDLAKKPADAKPVLLSQP